MALQLPNKVGANFQNKLSAQTLPTMPSERKIFRWDNIKEVLNKPRDPNFPVDISVLKFLKDFSNTEPLISPTPTNNHWCFFYAVQRSLASQGIIASLPKLFQVHSRLVRDDGGTFSGLTDYTSNFGADQGARILHEWGLEVRLGDVQLGVYRSDVPGHKYATDPNAYLQYFPGSEVKTADHTVWVKLSGSLDLGHYEGMAPIGAAIRPFEVEISLAFEGSQDGQMADRILAVHRTLQRRGVGIEDMAHENLSVLVSPDRFSIQGIEQLVYSYTVGELTAPGRPGFLFGSRLP